MDKYKDGDLLVAVGGNRRCKVADLGGELWAIPVVKDGMEDMPLSDWIESTLKGKVRKIIRKEKRMSKVKEKSVQEHDMAYMANNYLGDGYVCSKTYRLQFRRYLWLFDIPVLRTVKCKTVAECEFAEKYYTLIKGWEYVETKTEVVIYGRK